MKTSLVILMIALRAVESSNGTSSRNELQIQPICVEDVNRIYGTSYTVNDVFNKRKSEDIAILYLDYWAKKKCTNPTYEDYARIWNGGPNGYKKKSTIKYWNKVKKELQKNGYKVH